MTASTNSQKPAKRSPLDHIVNLIVGWLIGMAELVPGVSGGTVALVTGIYGRALRNGTNLIRTVKAVFSDRKNLKQHASKVEWVFIATVGIGMVAAVLTLSGLMHNFVENSPKTARALFLGMVAISLIVPLKMVDKKDFATKKIPAIAIFLVAAVLVFLLTGVTSVEKQDPSLLIVFGAAAIAVCALVLPGISGSFMLLAMGLYGPIMGAVSDRDPAVMGVFILGALTGLTLFIRGLDYLLSNHHTLTMMAMAGFMLGSLRALWPWQDDEANLLAPGNNLSWLLLVMAIGGVIAGGVMILERFTDSGEIEDHDDHHRENNLHNPA